MRRSTQIRHSTRCKQRRRAVKSRAGAIKRLLIRLRLTRNNQNIPVMPVKTTVRWKEGVGRGRHTNGKR